MVGPRRLTNFFGHINADKMENLKSVLHSSNANHTVVFSHYPLFTTTSEYPKRDSIGWFDTFKVWLGLHSPIEQLLSSNASLYLSGHIHDGLGDELHAWY